MYELRLSPEFEREYADLKGRRAKGNGEARYLLEIVENGLAKLARDPEAGRHIPKRLIPREYKARYDVNNLWKINLDSYWRLVYTLKGSRVSLVSIVLEVMDHPSYDRKFGYHT